MNRRAFVGASAALVTGGAGVVGYTMLIEPHWLEIVTRDLPIANLPPELNGATLAHVSDLHACRYVDEDYLTRSLDRLKPLSPDIVVLTGDFVTWEQDRSGAEVVAQLRRVMSHLPHGRRTVQATVPAAARSAGQESALHLGRNSRRRESNSLYQPRRRASFQGEVQRSAGNHSLHAAAGIVRTS